MCRIKSRTELNIYFYFKQSMNKKSEENSQISENFPIKKKKIKTLLLKRDKLFHNDLQEAALKYFCSD